MFNSIFAGNGFFKSTKPGKKNQIINTKHCSSNHTWYQIQTPQQIIQISRLRSNSNGGNLIMLNKHQTQSATTATSQMFPAFTPPLLERKICAKFSTRVSSRKSNLHPPISSPTQLPLLCSWKCSQVGGEKAELTCHHVNTHTLLDVGRSILNKIVGKVSELRVSNFLVAWENALILI